jgi:hypothetical protein
VARDQAHRLAATKPLIPTMSTRMLMVVPLVRYTDQGVFIQLRSYPNYSSSIPTRDDGYIKDFEEAVAVVVP